MQMIHDDLNGVVLRLCILGCSGKLLHSLGLNFYMWHSFCMCMWCLLWCWWFPHTSPGLDNICIYFCFCRYLELPLMKWWPYITDSIYKHEQSEHYDNRRWGARNTRGAENTTSNKPQIPPNVSSGHAEYNLIYLGKKQLLSKGLKICRTPCYVNISEHKEPMQ